MNDAAINTGTLASVLGAGGVLADRYNAVWERLWQQSHVPPRVLEMCRLRLAQLHGAAGEFTVSHAAGVDAAQTEALRAGTYASGGGFGAADLALLEFTEIYAQDPAAISDELADAVKQHVGEPGLVCLVEALGFIEGRIRLALMFANLRDSAAK